MVSDDPGARTPLLASHGEHLGRLVKRWRERLAPESILDPGGTRRKRTLSQEDMARLIKSSSHWYARLERGDTGIYSADFLDRTATALRLSAEERRMLYLFAIGHEPTDVDPPIRTELTASLRHIVQQQTNPAYIANGTWDLLIYNAAMAEWFPWIATAYEANMMRWAFTYPAARVQLHNWETDWAPMLLAEMMVSQARHPGNVRIAHLIQEILDVNEFARELWHQGPSVRGHEDGRPRQLNLPVHQAIREIEIVDLKPRTSPEVSLTVLVPA